MLITACTSACRAYEQNKGKVMKSKAIITLILIVLALIIIFQNTQVVSFKIFFWQMTMSRIIWLLLVLIIGLVAGYIIGTTRKGAR